MRLFAPVTNWNARVELAVTVPEIVRTAFRLPRLGKPRATHIELPEDVAPALVDLEPMPARRTTYPAARPETVARAAEALLAAKRPVLLAGDGVIRRRALEALASSPPAAGPGRDHLHGQGRHRGPGPAGPPRYGAALEGGLPGPAGGAGGLRRVRPGRVVARVWNRDGGKRVRLVESTVAEVDRHSVPSAEVVGEIGDSLRTLTRAVEGATGPRWDWQRYRDRSFHHARNRDDSFPLKPERVVDDLCDALDDEDVLISDVGVHKLWRPPAPRPGGRTP